MKLTMLSSSGLAALLAIYLGAAASALGAPVVWNGPLMVFTEPQGGSGVDPADQDRITSNVWITRNMTQGFINAFLETSYMHFSSPAGTEWAFGDLADYASLIYTNWEGMFGGTTGGGPRSTLNRPTVVHLISDDIYLSVTLTNWGSSLGGFTYLRSTPPAVSITPLGNRVVLTWTNTAFTLQSANTITGAFTTLSGATSPYTNSVTNAQQYFRLVH